MLKESMQALQQTSFLGAGDSVYLEQLYDSFLKDPRSLSSNWRDYFEQSLGVKDVSSETIHSEIQDQFKQLVRTLRAGEHRHLAEKSAAEDATALIHAGQQAKVQALIDAYRLLGHLQADIDPLKMKQYPSVPELMLSYYDLSDSDLSQSFETGTLPGSKQKTLKQIIQDLQSIYCGTIASEFMQIPDSRERAWVEEQVEKLDGRQLLSPQSKLHILDRLIATEGLEKYLGAKYPGAKRFSIEGVDTLIVALDGLVDQAGSLGAKEIVIGMAHRGRLNVLVNIFGKNPSHLFDEFEGKHDAQLESGDVKYHQGFSSDIETPGGTLHLSLAFNPSHLEIVAPVVCGSVRARQERREDSERTQVMAIAIHGDAAFAGQGVVMETLNMSRTRACGIGGTIHLILNNQIGFTTSNPRDARSTLYCSDIGKMMEIPIFHVNADDPEAVFKVSRLALAYRNKYKKDVIIDLMGYRRHGHNEADEPAATQPEMYKIIRALPTVLTSYSEQLVQEGVITADKIETLSKDYRALLESRRTVRPARNQDSGLTVEYSSYWQPYFVTQDWRVPVETAIQLSLFKKIAAALTNLPQDFVLHPRVKKILAERDKMTKGELPADWGYGEIMAYATLLNEGYSVRLSGQDCSRGTFFHRHAVLHDQENGKEYTPLQHISKEQGHFTVYDSLLSEEAALAFEYGYSTTDPKKLVIWEAQFGDFVNGAQVVIDQFISSGEHKWGRLTGLVLLLPHGYEGQGPEHSSARLERFLQLCAEHNMQVCMPTTPAQVFHMLRRQLARPLRKPLIVMTPKSLLRNKLAVSSLEDFSEGAFLPVIDEVDPLAQKTIQRVILCSGKVYYDLLARRREEKKTHIGIIRVEQLYPFPEQELKALLGNYSQAKEIVWCQEEPQNQGAWYSSQHHIVACLAKGQRLQYVGRKPSAAPAVGYLHLHQEQQEALLKDALA